MYPVEGLRNCNRIVLETAESGLLSTPGPAMQCGMGTSLQMEEVWTRSVQLDRASIFFFGPGLAETGRYMTYTRVTEVHVNSLRNTVAISERGPECRQHAQSCSAVGPLPTPLFTLNQSFYSVLYGELHIFGSPVYERSHGHAANGSKAE